MKNTRLLLVIVLSALLTSCGTWGSVIMQECPSWSNFQGNCEMLQGFTDEALFINMVDWNSARLSVSGRMIINNPVNVIIYEEDGTTPVNTTTTILTQGTYYVSRTEEGKPASFDVAIAQKSESGSARGTFSVTMDLVRSVPTVSTP